MRNKRTLRYGLASVVLFGGALGGTLAACGDDDNAVTTRPDGGPVTPPDSGGTDASADSSTPTPAKLQFVNAATDLGPSPSATGNAIRVCYAVGATEASAQIAALAPLPDTKSSERLPFPGVFAGTGGPFPSTGVDLSGLVVVPYVMNAFKLEQLRQAGRITGREGATPGTSCRDLFLADAGGPLVEGSDFWKLPAIPAGTLQSGKSFVLLLTGCSGNATASPSLKCGSDFTDAGVNGNLKSTIYTLDTTTTVGAGSFGTHFVHASPPAQLLIDDAGFLPGFVHADAGVVGDAGFRSISNNQRVPLLNPITTVTQTQVDFVNDNFTFNPDSGLPSITFPQIAEATFGDPDAASVYRNGASFTFIAVGDPARGPDRATAEFFHVIALPNDPVIVPAQ
jgi:hypothetical protein